VRGCRSPWLTSIGKAGAYTAFWQNMAGPNQILWANLSNHTRTELLTFLWHSMAPLKGHLEFFFNFSLILTFLECHQVLYVRIQFPVRQTQIDRTLNNYLTFPWYSRHLRSLCRSLASRPYFVKVLHPLLGYVWPSILACAGFVCLSRPRTILWDGWICLEIFLQHVWRLLVAFATIKYLVWILGV
jgi:hypothetical protein